jgi:A/G-specific adenine glycosylase
LTSVDRKLRNASVSEGTPADIRPKTNTTVLKRPVRGTAFGRALQRIRVSTRRKFTRRLLKWFRLHGRRFPWRNTADPYRIFVAEFMLQRTGAHQVLPIYKSFISRFPDIHAAIQTDKNALKTILRPLGRVERYRVLLKAFAHLLRVEGSRIPSSLDRLLKIPGIGQYTARAILVLAYRRRLGLFDPNIHRVIGRVFGILSSKARPHTDPAMWGLLDRMMPKGRSRDANLALLDFAVAVCRPRKPLCLTCPMRDICVYYRRTGA